MGKDSGTVTPGPSAHVVESDKRAWWRYAGLPKQELRDGHARVGATDTRAPSFRSSIHPDFSVLCAVSEASNDKNTTHDKVFASLRF